MSFELPDTDQNPHQQHIADLLPAYLNATLTVEERERVQTHLAHCGACQSELDLWRAIASATRERLAPATPVAPAPGLLEGVWQRIDAPPLLAGPLARAARTIRAQVPHAGRVLRGQVPLIAPGIWVLSAAAVALTLLVATISPEAAVARSLLSLVVPLVTAIGVALLYGPEQDPGLEVTLSTPTSPRLVLICRLALIFGYNSALATGVTLLLVRLGGAHFSLLASLWVGPTLLLAGLSLLLSVSVGAMAGMASAFGLVLLRLFLASLDAPGSQIQTTAWPLDRLWQTSPLILALAAVLIVASVVLVAKQERLA
jgi:hypothetical protein